MICTIMVGRVLKGAQLGGPQRRGYNYIELAVNEAGVLQTNTLPVQNGHLLPSLPILEAAHAAHESLSVLVPSRGGWGFVCSGARTCDNLVPSMDLS